MTHYYNLFSFFTPEMTWSEKWLAEKSVFTLGRVDGVGGWWVMKIPAEVEKMLSGKYQNAQQACKQALIPAWICAAQHFKIYF